MELNSLLAAHHRNCQLFLRKICQQQENYMRLPTLTGVERASSQLIPYHRETPLVRAELISSALKADVWLKNETVSPNGCFKLRGALIDILRAMDHSPITRLVTSSTGNHGQGVAYAGRLLNLPVTIFLPR